ncbi:hypothetical protein [Microbacterium maritypicum]
MKITIPDAWITERNYLFVVPSVYGDVSMAAEHANAILSAWDYPITLTPSDFLPKSIRRWVDPTVIANESWPVASYSKEPVDGWVKLYVIDLDDFEPDPGSA